MNILTNTTGIMPMVTHGEYAKIMAAMLPRLLLFFARSISTIIR